MEDKDFKNLIKEKDRIEAKVSKKGARIEAVRDETRKKVQKLRRQKKKAIQAFDGKIAALKSSAKKKLFLLKDTSEFSKEQSDKIDDMISMEFEEKPEPAEGSRAEAPAQPEERSPSDREEVRIALNNFRYKVKNEPSFRKEFKGLKALLAGKPGFEAPIASIEKLLANGSSRIVREEILEKLKDVGALLV